VVRRASCRTKAAPEAADHIRRNAGHHLHQRERKIVLGRHVRVVSAAGWSSPGLVRLPEPVDATVGIYYRGTCCYRWL
jgi:hypothetical protein